MLQLLSRQIISPLRRAIQKPFHFPMQSIFLSPTQQISPQIGQVRCMANYKHKKLIKMAKGYRGRANRCYTVAKQRVEKALQYQYRDRRTKKRDYRKLWIQRINAASRMYGVTYAQLIYKLDHSNIKLNRKVLAELAFNEPLSFKSVIEVAKLCKGPINVKAVMQQEQKAQKLEAQKAQKLIDAQNELMKQ